MTKYQSSSEVVRAAPSKSTDRAAGGFEDILVEHMEKLWAVSLSFCKYNQQDAEDLLQDSVIRAFRYRDTLMAADNPLAWLRKVLLNTYLNRVRDEKKWNTREDLDLAREVVAEEQEELPSLLIDSIRTDLWDDEIKKALDSLPESHRTLFLLSDVEHLSREEIAEVTGLSLGTISSRIFRSRKKLAELLEHYALQKGIISKDRVAQERVKLRMSDGNATV